MGATAASARIHLARIDAVAARARAAGLDWLTTAERARLAGMQAPARQASFLAGHWLAREQAAAWLRRDVDALVLDVHPDGRPRLRADNTAAPLHVSISHSDGWLALALADAPVGVDLELPQRTRDWLALARFVFSPAETRWLQDVPDAERAGVFHVLWTLKEARGKRHGEGLQPRAARRIAAEACAVDRAEATSWAWGDGALALALAPGARIEIAGAAALEAPAYWRYRACTASA